MKLKNFYRVFTLGALALGFLVTGILGCGAASPPAGIPAPVSQLMAVGNPDSNGEVTLSGQDGAVNGGATVSAANTSQGGVAQKILKIFYSLAYAQGASVQTTTVADANGAFQLKLLAGIGDTIRVVQIVDGERSPPTDLVVGGKTVNLGVTPKGLAVDPAYSEAYVTGAESTEGQIFRLKFVDGEGPVSFPEPFVEITGYNGIGPVAFFGLDGVTTSKDQVSAIQFEIPSGIVTPSPPTVVPAPKPPVSISASELPFFAAIGFADSDESINLYITQTQQFFCSILIPHPTDPSNVSHLSTPLVEFQRDLSGDERLWAVSLFDDDSLAATKIDFVIGSGPTCDNIAFTQIPLPSGVNPAGLGAIYLTNKALISDANSNQVYVVDFVSLSYSTIMVGNSPRGIAIDDLNNRAYVVNHDDNTISVIDLTTLSVVDTIENVGLSPTEIELLPQTNQAVVLSTFDNSVLLVDLPSSGGMPQ